MKASIETFTRHLESEERRLGVRTRSRREADQRSFRLAVEAIACNLLITAMTGQDATLSVPRSHDAMWGQGRYRNPVYGQHFRDALDLLETLKLASRATKGYRFSATARQATTIRATSKLTRHLPLGVTDWSAFRCVAEPELIVLKPRKDDDRRTQPVDYKDTARTERWRREMQAINAWLAAAPISVIADKRRTIRLDNEGQPVEPYRRSLRRVFNNENWNAGGRLFGGFWMTMERTERFRTIRIAGEEIANVDFSSLFPRLAYARAGIEQPDEDVYDLIGDGTCRDGWKTLINAMLFATRPLRGWPTGAREGLPAGIKLRDAVDAIKGKHSPIAKLLERGLGFELMSHEAGMLVSVVTALFKNGVTALPLHDSVLVPRSNAATAKDFMEQEFKYRTGSARAFVKIDFEPI
ncbi:MAG TPA: hypothetical protein VIJ67_07800 [Pseudolabrys sp.]